jgi:hypothetical protein
VAFLVHTIVYSARSVCGHFEQMGSDGCVLDFGIIGVKPRENLVTLKDLILFKAEFMYHVAEQHSDGFLIDRHLLSPLD